LDAERAANARAGRDHPVIARVQNRVRAHSGEKAIGGFNQRLPVNAREGRMVVARPMFVATYAQEVRVIWIASEGEIDIPEQLFPGVMFGLVGIAILAAA